MKKLRATFVLLLLALIGGCNSVPTHTMSKDFYSPVSNSGIVLFTPFRVPKQDTGAGLFLMAAMFGGAQVPEYRAVVYDVTDRTQYLGSVTTGIGLGQWLEAEVALGKRTFMVNVEGTSHADFVEVSVNPDGIKYVALSPEGFSRYPYMYELKVRPELISPCVNLPVESKSGVSDAIETKMRQLGLSEDMKHYSRFCYALAPSIRNIYKPNSEGQKEFRKNIAKIGKLRDEGYREWLAERDTGVDIPFDLLAKVEQAEREDDPRAPY